jgi:toxin ParE1/3/4
VSVRLSPSADADVERAFQWYEAQRLGLGRQFIQRVDEAIARIERNPLAQTMLVLDARRVNLKQFPYGLWYTVRESGEIVVACLHHRRDPRLVKDRMKGVIQFPEP